MSDRVWRLFSYRRAVIAAGVALCVALFIFFVLPLLLFAVMSLSARTTAVEIQRSRSPDGLLDAVVVQSQPGFSIEPDSYRIYLARSGSDTLDNPVLVATDLEGLKMQWAAPHLLELSYSSACIASFRNHWANMAFRNGDYYVEVRLESPEGASRNPCP
jgi:hypothetical protein